MNNRLVNGVIPGKPAALALVTVLLVSIFSFPLFSYRASAVESYSWEPLMGPGDGDAYGMAWDAGDSVLYRATDRRGVWKYDGSGWSIVDDGTTNVKGYYTSCLALDEGRDVLYAGTWYTGVPPVGYGVWRCSDPSGNPSWSKISGPGDVGNLAITSIFYEAGGNRLYVGGEKLGTWGRQGQGVWRCDNPDGSSCTWTKICDEDDAIKDYQVAAFEYDAAHGNLFAGCENSTGGVWRCDNPGASSPFTWQKISPEGDVYYGYALTLDATGARLYVGSSGVYRCDDPNGTPSWQRISSSNNIGGANVPALSFGDGSLYAASGVGLWRCDGPEQEYPGDLWTRISEGVETGGLRSLCYVDGTPDRLFVGTRYYGVWTCSSPQGSPSWTNTGGGLSSLNTGNLTHDGVRDVLYVGTESGVWRCQNPGDSYTWQKISSAADVGGKNTLVAYDKSRNILYAGASSGVGGQGCGVWRCDDPDGSWSWTMISGPGDLGGRDPVSISFDHVSGILYASTSGGGVWRCEHPHDSSYSWDEITGPLGTRLVQFITNDDDRDVIYAYCSHAPENDGIWRLSDASQADGWEKISTALDIGYSDVAALAVDGVRDMVYVATIHDGAWRCDDPRVSPSWKSISEGMPAGVAFFDLEYDGSHNLLYAPSAYHGVWTFERPDSDDYAYDNNGGECTDIEWRGACYDPGTGRLYNGAAHKGVWRAGLKQIVSCQPASGARGQMLDVTVEGARTGFQQGLSEAVFSGEGIVVNSTTVIDATHVVANVTILDDAPLEARDVGVEGTGAPDPMVGAFMVSDFRQPVITSLSPAEGWPGRTVAINGSAFGYRRDGSQVRFGSIAVTTFSSWSDTKIECEVPPGLAGNVEVTATTQGGTSNGRVFTVGYPPPTITSITPSTAPNDGVVNVTSLAGANFRKGASVKLGRSGQPEINAGNVNVVSGGRITCTFDLRNKQAGDWDLSVRNTDGKSATKARAFRVAAPDPPTPVEQHTWYLAEGTTAWGFDTYISIVNPNDRAVTASITYMTPGGSVPGGAVILPAMSQATVNPRETLGDRDFSTRVECAEKKAIAVDRTMTWAGAGSLPGDAHCSIGVTSPARTWYLPEGSASWGFECWLLIQNPNDVEAVCRVTYMIENVGPRTVEKRVPANSRDTFNMADDLEDTGIKDASIKVESNVPVIGERAMYRNSRRGGHCSIGTTTPSGDYYLAEGTTAWGFTTYVLVQNPNDAPAVVTLTYMTPSGPKPQEPFTLDANSRKTVKVNDALPNSDFSTLVSGSLPVIAERAMYWDAGSGEACHDSIGMSEPHATFYLPDGQTGGGYETWTLIQNPNGEAVTVEITYMTPTGEGNVTNEEVIPANSRSTFEMGTHGGINGRAATTVTSKTAGKKVMVERAMYWNSRGAGTVTIGGFPGLN